MDTQSDVSPPADPAPEQPAGAVEETAALLLTAIQLAAAEGRLALRAIKTLSTGK
jgi:hypothetical protein